MLTLIGSGDRPNLDPLDCPRQNLKNLFDMPWPWMAKKLPIRIICIEMLLASFFTVYCQKRYFSIPKILRCATFVWNAVFSLVFGRTITIDGCFGFRDGRVFVSRWQLFHLTDSIK